MSERDMIQANEDLEKESLESTEAKTEARGLEEATHEPGSRVEQTGNIEQAEAIEASVKELVDASQSTDKLVGDQKGAADISEELIEKELPEEGQMQKDMQEQEDLGAIADGDFGSLTPGPGKLTDPYGKENIDTDPGLGLGDAGFGGKQGIDSSSENPEGEPFIPGKGPGGGVTEGIDPTLPVTSIQEAEVMEMLARGASEKEIAAKEKQLQDDALDRHQLVFGPPPPPPPPTPKKTSTESTPGEAGGRKISPPTAEEVERVIEKTSGDEISMKDPDSAGSEGTPDSVLPKYADKIEAALGKKHFVHKEKKAGAEVVTDPDQEQPEADVKGKKETK